MKKVFLSLMAAAFLLPAATAMADSSLKNETDEYQFVEVKCSDTAYTKQVDPGRRIVIPSSEFNGKPCSIDVEGQAQKYRILDQNNYQIKPNGTVTKTAG